MEQCADSKNKPFLSWHGMAWPELILAQLKLGAICMNCGRGRMCLARLAIPLMAVAPEYEVPDRGCGARKFSARIASWV